MSEHRHSYSPRFDKSTTTCTVKLFECPCGYWRLRHYGCHGNWDSAALERELRTALEVVDIAAEGIVRLERESDEAQAQLRESEAAHEGCGRLYCGHN